MIGVRAVNGEASSRKSSSTGRLVYRIFTFRSRVGSEETARMSKCRMSNRYKQTLTPKLVILVNVI